MGRPNDPPLQPEDAVARSLEMIQRDGLAEFSMRKLARELDISAPTLYYHFSNKDEILRAVAERMVSQMRPLPETDDPIDAIVAHSKEYFRILTAHPNAVELIGAAFRRDHSLKWYEYLVHLLEKAEVPASTIVAAVEALDGLLQGMAAHPPFLGADGSKLGPGDLKKFPQLRAAVAQDRSTSEDRLELAVRALLMGWSEAAQKQPGKRVRVNSR